MDRLKSTKRVLGLDECCHKFKTIFVKGNCERGLMIGVNDDTHFYPLNVEVELPEPDWFVVRDINPIRGFYVEEKYNPFEEDKNAI